MHQLRNTPPMAKANPEMLPSLWHQISFYRQHQPPPIRAPRGMGEVRLAFIMPSEAESKKIEFLRESVIEMRSDQIKHLEHLLRSWRVFGRSDSIALIWRAIKRTLRDYP